MKLKSVSITLAAIFALLMISAIRDTDSVQDEIEMRRARTIVESVPEGPPPAPVTAVAGWEEVEKRLPRVRRREWGLPHVSVFENGEQRIERALLLQGREVTPARVVSYRVDSTGKVTQVQAPSGVNVSGHGWEWASERSIRKRIEEQMGEPIPYQVMGVQKIEWPWGAERGRAVWEFDVKGLRLVAEGMTGELLQVKKVASH